MIEQALHVLTLHNIWKGNVVASGIEPSSEETRYKEILVAQRESLLEKLVEYAIGTQSNTVDGVKRAVWFLIATHINLIYRDIATLGLQAPPRSPCSLCIYSSDGCRGQDLTTVFIISFS
jgi:cohesin complex subunit SA-1/2